MNKRLLLLSLSLLFIAKISVAQDWAGAAEANTRFGAANFGGFSAGYNYMALQDHIGPSGVPLGGIGAGCVQFTPTGNFTRTTGINNWFTDAVTDQRVQNIELEKGHFIAVWDKDSEGRTVIRRLQKDDIEVCGIKGYSHSVYKGLFPTVDMYFTEDKDWWMPSPSSVKAWSGFVADDLNATTTPCFWVDVTVANSTNFEETAVAFSWADLIGQGLLEPIDVTAISVDPYQVGHHSFKEVDKPDTKAVPYNNGEWVGVRQTICNPMPKPQKMTFQTAVNDVVIMVQQQDGAEISIMPSYSIKDGTSAWSQFAKNGKFEVASEKMLASAHDELMASAVAIKTKIPVGGKKTFRFAVMWYAPAVEQDPAQSANPQYKYGVGDYGAWYQNNYKSIDDLARYAATNGDRVYAGVQKWHKPILESNMPDWMKFKLINSSYSLYTNGIINRDGDYTNMEGGMGGLSATMDVRMIMHPLVHKFFHATDRHEMKMFSASQEPEIYIDGTQNVPSRVGAISHMLGNYFTGLATTDYPGPCIIDVNMDGTCGYMMQIVKDYEQTGDKDWLNERYDNIKKAVNYLKNNIVDERGIPNGRATYDDYHHPQVFAYNASIFLMGLEAAIRAAKIMDDSELLSTCEEMKRVAHKGYMSLWNGRFFAYGANRGSDVLINDRFHQGQVGGQSLARYCGWDDIVTPEMLDAVFTVQCKDVLSKVPYRYANKVWDLQMNRGVDHPGTQCWPFQLEIFTAMTMLQNGWIEDAMDIMYNIQLVHLQKGWTWTYNLWNPAELSRMDAPASWMLLENLSGAALNIPQQTITLGPGIIPGEDKLVCPLYFPDFWATLTFDPTRKITKLVVTNKLTDKNITLTKLNCRPMGKSSSEAKIVSIKPFKVEQGAVLDLSKYTHLLAPVIRRGVLNRVSQIPYIEVKAD